MINYSNFESQHKWGTLFDHLMRTRIFTLIMNEVFIQTLAYIGAISLVGTVEAPCMCIESERRRQYEEYLLPLVI